MVRDELQADPGRDFRYGAEVAQSGFGVAGPLAATQLTLYDDQSNPIATDTGWGNRPTGGSASVAVAPAGAGLMSGVGAFALGASSKLWVR